MFYSKKFKTFKNINHCFFSRKGGFSKGIYNSLNCGLSSEDSKTNVLNNLNLVSKKMNISSKKLMLMYQTHSSKVIVINKKNKNLKKFQSDAIITKMKGYALAVVTADCVPIIFYDIKNKIIGCAHAGWKGALNGIIENTLNEFKKLNANNRIYASVGPCIGKRSYEVNLDFYKKFISETKNNKIYFLTKNKKKKLFDLREYIGDKLLKLNVKVDQVNHDTFSDKDNFFSYRRSQKLYKNDYGRCISIVSLP